MREPKDINILVVDDEPALRKAIVFDFKKKGFNVREAENGKLAFEIIKSEKIDLVLTDVRMPGGDGIELLENVKTRDPNLPVVMFITGFADITVEEAYDKGVNAVFSKPFDRKALLAAVLRAVSAKDEQWQARKTERLDSHIQLPIDLVFTDLKTSLQGKVLNIGRGGFFVAIKEPTVAVESKAHFNIKFQEGSITIEGTGIIRWVRTQGDEDLPSGYGIEFDSLSDLSRSQVIELINTLKTKSFIPKS
ncbi:MAG: response regulator [Bdellovibrionales bacterium]